MHVHVTTWEICWHVSNIGDNAFARIDGKGTISIDNGKTKTHNVLYVEVLKHNLISVSQMCDQGYNLTFHSKGFEIRKLAS
jgi:hypothetical protein